jgi:hypothetical protein
LTTTTAGPRSGIAFNKFCGKFLTATTSSWNSSWGIVATITDAGSSGFGRRATIAGSPGGRGGSVATIATAGSSSSRTSYSSGGGSASS